MSNKRILFLVIVILTVLFFSYVMGCAPEEPVPEAEPEPEELEAPELIRVGYAISFSGPYSTGASITQIPNYKLWEELVNERGGIYLSKYDEQVPIELIEYDDGSDIDTAIRMIERLVEEDEVDLLLPPWGTAMNFAVAPIINEYGYPIMTPTATDMDWYEVGPDYPYVFTMLANPDVTVEGLVEFLHHYHEAGDIGNEVAIIYVEDKFGIEHADIITPILEEIGFEIVHFESYPLGVTDLSSELREIQGKAPDIFIAFSYPGDTFMIVEQSGTLDFNPPIFYTSVGTAFPSFRDNYGTDVVEGVMGHGAWNPSSPFEWSQEYFEKHVEVTGQEPDRWASAHAYATLQILEQAIEEVGSIDRAEIMNVIATGEFKTLIGPVTFDEYGINTQHPGIFGQWQAGEFEMMWPLETATAEPIIPKPDWP